MAQTQGGASQEAPPFGLGGWYATGAQYLAPAIDGVGQSPPSLAGNDSRSDATVNASSSNDTDQPIAQGERCRTTHARDRKHPDQRLPHRNRQREGRYGASLGGLWRSPAATEFQATFPALVQCASILKLRQMPWPRVSPRWRSLTLTQETGVFPVARSRPNTKSAHKLMAKGEVVGAGHPPHNLRQVVPAFAELFCVAETDATDIVFATGGHGWGKLHRFHSCFAHIFSRYNVLISTEIGQLLLGRVA